MRVIRQVFEEVNQTNGKTAVLSAALLSFLIFLTTLQLHINGSNHPYATDIGEIQNALPRWGTLHFTGYPQYTALGSLFVTLLRPFLSPAVSSSLFSAVWGAVSIGLLVWLMRLFDIRPLLAVAASLLFALAASMWVDSSIAEVHTMTMALTLAVLIVAVRFGRSGSRHDLYWLAFLSGQGIAHQRAFAFVGLGLFILVLPQWRTILGALPAVIGLGLIGPLTYIYLPLRAWMGAEWVFSSPGTWAGFRALLLDTKAERIVKIPVSLSEWQMRFRDVTSLLTADWPWPLWTLGLVGLAWPQARRRERLGLTLSWLPYLVISLIIWEGYVSDALLAVKLPVIALASVGLAFLGQAVWQKRPEWAPLLLAAFVLGVSWLFIVNRPKVLAVTRDQGTFATIADVSRVPPAEDGRSQTLMALWGHNYWALAYAQAYDGRFPNLHLVDHDTDFNAILNRGEHLLTLSETFYQRPLAWWEEVLGAPVSLSTVAPQIVEINTVPQVTAVSSNTTRHDLGNGLLVRNATLTWLSPTELLVTIDWQAARSNLPDYSVAVHLVKQDPPTGSQDILAQADHNHPVEGWYPTSRWKTGEVVRDSYLLTVPLDQMPASVRVSMYQVVDGQFENSDWLSLGVPERP